MACDKAPLSQAYADGELDPTAAVAIEEHLAGCAECRALIDGVRELSLALRREMPRLD